jgi:hypothetical protein
MRGQVWHPGGHTEAPRGGTPHPNPLPQREREYGKGRVSMEYIFPGLALS